MNDLIDMLREAFEAGMNYATEYEHGSRGYYPDFKKWVEQNMTEIENLNHLLKIIDGHKRTNQ